MSQEKKLHEQEHQHQEEEELHKQKVHLTPRKWRTSWIGTHQHQEEEDDQINT